MAMMASSRYRGYGSSGGAAPTVDVILEEGSSDDDDFMEQEARLNAEEQLQYSGNISSRPNSCEGREAPSNTAYGEAVAILDQASLACDREFATSPPITIQEQHQEKKPFLEQHAAWTDPSDDMVLPALANKAGSEERVMSPSDSALDNGQLFPCNVCGRTFLQKALERHVKVCQKVSTKKRNVFDLAKKRTEGMEPVPASKEPPKRKIVKPEDEFQQCPSCHRKFGDKAFDRHVKWCVEKSRRMQTSPKKDLEALAKLQARIAYRPKTPSRKESSGSGGSPSRKTSNTSMDSTGSAGDLMSRSFSSMSRSESRNGYDEDQFHRRKSYSGTKSLGRSSGISFLKDVEHTKETQETNFIRAATGRGSIKRGPAPTRASVLRAAKTSDVRADSAGRSRTPSCPLHNPPSTPTLRRRAASPANNYQFQSLVKPSVVRPYRSSSSYGMRREPEGIEHEHSTPRSSRPPSALAGGHYDHSQEYDPYQSAQRQMQELLFGSSAKNSSDADLRPSTNSAFQKYIPSANVPSTAELNSKLSAPAAPRRTSFEPSSKPSSSWIKPSVSSSWGSKVAKFCHECGNAFSMADIRFCCECGVKRLYM